MENSEKPNFDINKKEFEELKTFIFINTPIDVSKASSLLKYKIIKILKIDLQNKTISRRCN